MLVLVLVLVLDREVMPMDILSLFAARSQLCKTIEHDLVGGYAALCSFVAINLLTFARPFRPRNLRMACPVANPMDRAEQTRREEIGPGIGAGTI